MESATPVKFAQKLLALAPGIAGPERVAEIRDVFARRNLKA